MDLGTKFWLVERGKPVLGSGRLALLKAIEREGSISGAAKRLKISFRSAWGSVGNAEKNLGLKLLDRRKGGAGGGRTTLTEEGRELIAKFDRLVVETREFAERRFDSLFGGFAR